VVNALPFVCIGRWIETISLWLFIRSVVRALKKHPPQVPQAMIRWEFSRDGGETWAVYARGVEGLTPSHVFTGPVMLRRVRERHGFPDEVPPHQKWIT
jgi:hypothetical protein